MESRDTVHNMRYNNIYVSRQIRSGNSGMSGFHYHDSFEIYYLLAGGVHYFIKDRTYRLQQGDMVVIDRNELHKTMYTSGAEHERILLEFKEGFINIKTEDINLLSVFDKENNLINFDFDEKEYAESILLRIVEESKYKKVGYYSAIRFLLLELLICLERAGKKDVKQVFRHPSPVHGRVSGIVRYINSNYDKNISLADLSKRFYMSRYHLCRVFKKVTGFSFVEYLNGIRVKEAGRLLEETDLRVIDIASSVGFESPTHFGRVFKSITGLSPGQYRKSKQGITPGEFKYRSIIQLTDE